MIIYTIFVAFLCQAACELSHDLPDAPSLTTEAINRAQDSPGPENSFSSELRAAEPVERTLTIFRPVPELCVDKTIGIYPDPSNANCFYYCYGGNFPGEFDVNVYGYQSCCGSGKVYRAPTLRYPVGACFDPPPPPKAKGKEKD